jgi:hypothetical protein
MTTYGKPRWPNVVFFGSYRDLKYRIDIHAGDSPFFQLRSNSGPGFNLALRRSSREPGFESEGAVPPAAAAYWLNNPSCCQAVVSLFHFHFSRLRVEPDSIVLHCDPATDILPEGSQLNWAMAQVHLLIAAVPQELHRSMLKSRFIA